MTPPLEKCTPGIGLRIPLQFEFGSRQNNRETVFRLRLDSDSVDISRVGHALGYRYKQFLHTELL